MGTRIITKGANYIIDKRFNIVSNHGEFVSFTGGVLTVKSITTSISLYQYVVSLDFSRKIRITTDLSSNIAANSIIIGITRSTKEPFVLNVSGIGASSGAVKVFYKDGTQSAAIIDIGNPTVEKGDPTTIEWGDTGMTIICTNGSYTIPYSSIPDWGGKAVGGFAVGTEVLSKYFIEEIA